MQQDMNGGQGSPSVDLYNQPEEKLINAIAKADEAGDIVAAQYMGNIVKERRRAADAAKLEEQSQSTMSPFSSNYSAVQNLMANEQRMQARESNLAAFSGGVAEGVGNIAANIANAGNYMAEKVGIDVSPAHNPLNQFAEYAQTSGQEMYQHVPDSWVKDLSVGVGRELPGYMATPTRFISGASRAASVAREALRGAGGAMGQDEYENLGEAATGALKGAAVGAASEVAGQGLRIGSEYITNKFSRGVPENDRAAILYRYNEIKKEGGVISDDVLNSPLPKADGTPSNVTYRDVKEIEEKLRFAGELNKVDAKVGLETVERLLGDKTSLEKMGIYKSRSESAYAWLNKTIGSEWLERVGIRELDVDKKRTEAIVKASEKKFKDFIEIADKKVPAAGQFKILADSVKAIKKGDYDTSQALTEQFEESMKGLMKSYRDNTTPEKFSEYERDYFSKMYSMARDVKALRKFAESGRKGDVTEVQRVLGSAAALFNIGFLTHPLAALAVPVAQRAAAKQFTKGVGKSVDEAIGLFDKPLTSPKNVIGYHGSPQKAFTANPTQDLWLMQNHKDARRYGRGNYVMPVSRELSNPDIVDAGGAPVANFQKGYIKQARERGHDSIQLNNVRLADGSIGNIVILISKDGVPEVTVKGYNALNLLGLGTADNEE